MMKYAYVVIDTNGLPRTQGYFSADSYSKAYDTVEKTASRYSNVESFHVSEAHDVRRYQCTIYYNDGVCSKIGYSADSDANAYLKARGSAHGHGGVRRIEVEEV